MRYETLSMERSVWCLLLLKTYAAAFQVQLCNRDKICNLTMEQCNAVDYLINEKQGNTCTCSRESNTLISSLSSRPYGCRELAVTRGTTNIYLVDFYHVTLKSIMFHAL